MATKRWKCIVCGYIHKGDEPPEKCPACGADRSKFVEIDEQGTEIKAREEKKEEPKVEEGEVVEKDTTESLPVEVAKEEEKVEEKVEEPKQEEAKQEEQVVEGKKDKGEGKTKEKSSRTFLDWLGGMVMKSHLHPIAVHTPNGVLPMAVIFMVLAIYFKYQNFELPSFYSLAFVLVMMPVVLFTGYLEWQMRYSGAKTFLFVTKILCSLVVLASVSTLVIWRIVDPGVTAPESPERMTYLIVGLVALGAAGLAGHLGGKLVFGRAGD